MNPLATDLDFILRQTASLWSDLRGERLFITGGTGFFGCWLLESLVWANDQLGLEAHVVALTRDPSTFARKVPHIAFHPAVTLLEGDVRSFAFPSGNFSHIIHAATDADAEMIVSQPLAILDTTVDGTRRVLDFAIACRAKRFLLTSSGAIYGIQPSELTHLTEDYLGAPDTMGIASSYGEGKRISELLCATYSRKCSVETVIARCFAFFGPYLPLDKHYAIGNFLRDGMQHKPIQINGDGSSRRSYLYAADLTVWLWTLLFRGRISRSYNVGSEDDMSIADLAYAVAEMFGGLPVEIAKVLEYGKTVQRYVPSTARARGELHLTNATPLTVGLEKSITWYRHQESITQTRPWLRR